jgi:hypothetical protein
MKRNIVILFLVFLLNLGSTISANSQGVKHAPEKPAKSKVLDLGAALAAPNEQPKRTKYLPENPCGLNRMTKEGPELSLSGCLLLIHGG